MQLHTDYKNPVLRQLCDQQVRFAPRDAKLAQIDRAERLLAELDPARTYTYEYLCFRLTDYRPTQFPNVKMSGEEAAHDLRRFVEDMSDAAEIEAEKMPEPVLTVEDLSERFRVSTKTISRWREQGLVSRRFRFNGRKRVGFLESSVDRFVRGNEERVRRGSNFSQMTDEERDTILSQARRFAHAGGAPAEVAKRLARRTGRSAETIRYTIKQFDQENPDLAIFPDKTGPLTEDAKRRIFHAYRRGVSVDKLADEYGRTRTPIYRTINEMRARRIMALPLDYMPSDEFNLPGASHKILSALPEGEAEGRKTRAPSGLPPYLASLYESPLLSREQEQHLFRSYNYLKYRASKLRDKLLTRGQLDASKAKSGLLDEIERLANQAVEVKNEITRRNLRLVVSIAKRHVGLQDNFFELVSDGNMSLIRAVEKFDYARGNKFSTYATWAIMKNFARTIPGEQKQRDRFRTSQEEAFTGAEDDRSNNFLVEAMQRQREAQVNRILTRLDDREQQIIVSRFGLKHGSEPKTLKEVGDEIGVTKERVRQIEARALSKLREAAQEEHVDLAELL